MLPRPNGLSSTKRITFLPLIGLIFASGAKSCSDVLPERNTYLLAAEVTASFLAGPEMNRTLFCAASGARVKATPDEAEPTIMFVPFPTISLNEAVADAGSAPSSFLVITNLRPSTAFLPLV